MICFFTCCACFKLVNAAKEFSATQVHLVGGVSANNDLRAQITSQLPANMSFKHPKKLSYCTDNAAMIAAAAYFVCKSDYIQAGKAVTPGNSSLIELVPKVCN